MNELKPKWHKEIEIFSKIKPLLMLEGNVLDMYQYPEEGNTPKGSILRLPVYLHYFFKDRGYQNIIFFDSMRGYYNTCEDGYLHNFANLINVKVENNVVKADFKAKTSNASSFARTVLTQSSIASVVIMDFASRYITSPDNLEQNEVDSYTVLLQSSLEAMDVKTKEHGVLKNLLILIVNKSNDIPAWFYIQNPSLRIISISKPAKEEREHLVKGNNFPTFFAGDIYMEDKPYYDDNPAELEMIKEKFISLTEGLSFSEINSLRRLCKNERIRIKDMSDVIDLYKYGISENPWRKLNLEAIKNAQSKFERRIKGQENAIVKTLDVVKRAITGLSGLQGSSHSRPKGVLFYAGPTGTGKTETAKTLAEVLFGHENCCIRFDMSEYGQGHSDQKLLGAPPGYVGYESGGQLTNAVRNNPFSIILFDEIEKAHPSILDKFLQILEDGRMTDGQGNTVYFSETIVIFTSNLGIYTRNEFSEREANVSSDMPYSEVSLRIKQAIDNYFKLDLGRPELLNRIGENIVIFDFIRPDVAYLILDSQIKKIISSLFAEKKIKLTISDDAKEALTNRMLENLGNGGRGIGNIVESLLINPLARYLFDNEVFNDAEVKVVLIDTNSIPAKLECTVVRPGSEEPASTET